MIQCHVWFPEGILQSHWPSWGFWPATKGPLQGQKSNSPLQWVGSPQAPEVASHVPRMASLFCPGFCSKFLGNVTSKLRTACRTNKDPDWWKSNADQRWRFQDSMARSHAPGFGWNCNQQSTSEDLVARTPAPGSCWNQGQNSGSDDSMARTSTPGFGWSNRQNSSFEDSMARSFAPGFGRTKGQNSSFEDSMARTPAPGFGWDCGQNSRSEDSVVRTPAVSFGEFAAKTQCCKAAGQMM